MGKKKKPCSTNTKQEGENIKKIKNVNKSYSLAGANQGREEDQGPGVIKVQIQAELEQQVVDLIQEKKEQNADTGNVSFRVSTRKLTDLYMSLSKAGFKQNQIEAAMNNTVKYGGGIVDALDWLCLNTPNDKLPDGYSQMLYEEENKNKPEREKFIAPPPPAPVLPASQPAVQPLTTKATQEENKGSNMKDWILRYAEEDSDADNDDDSLDGSKQEEIDPNEKYLELTAKLLDAKEQASQAKSEGNKDLKKQATNNIRQLSQEMLQLEKHPKFNAQIKIRDVEVEQQSDKEMDRMKDAGDDDDNDDCAGFGMFDEQAAVEEPIKPKPKVKRSELDIRQFAYTKQQWTGKSPKQFLIDWVRKHLPKSPPPKYNNSTVRGNLHKSRCTIKRPGKEDDVVVTQDKILSENVKEAEHLASTLALYTLCKGQRIYQLLPPAYRDVWLEWQDAEERVKQENKDEENKPRDQYISRLMKNLKIESSGSKRDDEVTQAVDTEDRESTWEDLADDDQEKPAMQPVSRGRKSKSELREILEEHQHNKVYDDLLQMRQELPVYQHRDEVLAAIRREQVTVIAGETGSGKSTQVPQFILEDCLARDATPHCNIVCTEPRRISAMSLADRVSKEMGEKGPGVANSLVGYQIRFETKRTDYTHLMYCTTGVLLRKLQLDPLLLDVTHVIVDEVHERSVDSDFLIIILKHLLPHRKDLKVVLMSATLDSTKFSGYFNHCPVLEIPGRLFPVGVHYLEDVVKSTGYMLDPDSLYALREDQLLQEQHAQLAVSGKRGHQSSVDVSWSKDDLYNLDLSELDPDMYDKQTRNTVTRLNIKRINMDLIVELLTHIDMNMDLASKQGAVLIFLPGLAHIQELHDRLNSEKIFSNPKRYRLVALHSVLSSHDQGQAFSVPPPGVRKIVLATNIAETGITIPDVVFVIDTGKVKETRYLEGSQMSTLEEVFISKASSKQRSGRAGRVQEGICFRLYTHKKYQSMKSYSVPEIQRVPLEELCLLIMKCELGNPLEFLSQAMDPPNPAGVGKAMNILREVGACVIDGCKLTPLGHHLAALPVNCRIGKMLLFAGIFGCLESISVIAAVMTDKSPFTAPLGKRDKVDNIKKTFTVAASDHLTVFKAYQGWEAARRQNYQSEQSYCNKNFLKRNSLLEIQNVSRDLRNLVQSIGFGRSKIRHNISREAHTEDIIKYSLSKRNIAIIKAVLVAGLYPNVCLATYVAPVDSAANPEKKICLVQTAQGLSQVHPSSVNSHLPATGWLVFQEKVKYTKVFIQDCSLVTTYPLLLFGGDISVQHTQQIVTVDNWIKFKAYARTAVIFKELRILIDDLLERKINNPKLNIEGDSVTGLLVDLIYSER